MVDFKIEKNVPIPEHRGRKKGFKYPWEEMQVGDSILIPKKSRSSAGSSYDYYSRTRTNKKAKFCSREEKELPDLVRVWRIK